MTWKIKLYWSSSVILSLVSLLSFAACLYFLVNDCCFFVDWEVLTLNSLSLNMAFIFDWASMMFTSFVCFIAAMVLYYSGGYMAADPEVNRFFYLVLAFVLSMLMLILSPNLVSILLGWDGLGLVSYALVIYYQNEKSAGAGMLTVLSNRIGDVALLLALSIMSGLGTWDFIFYGEGEHLPRLVIFFAMVAAMTKSAQVPFSAWLPEAMAAPTPVSALVHSSTLVTAGIYLLIRFSSGLPSSWGIQVLLLLGCLTMFMAGLGANFETDLKKIVALSTLSQLGVMIGILSLGWSELAFFHLLAHALFKALLFMCAGSIIHSVANTQDIRYMGGLSRSMPVTVTCFNLASLSLCGLPFLSGFYSKDLILEVAMLNPLNMVCFGLFALATGLTVSYTFRLFYYTLSGPFNLCPTHLIHDEDSLMTTPMLALSFATIVGGSVLFWFIFPAPVVVCLPLLFKLLPLILCVVGGSIGYVLNFMSPSCNLLSPSVYPAAWAGNSMGFLSYLSVFGLTEDFLTGGSIADAAADKGWLEEWGAQGNHTVIMFFVRLLPSGDTLKVYLMTLIFWLLFFCVK